MSNRSREIVQSGCAWIKRSRASFDEIMHLIERCVSNGEDVQRGDIYSIAKRAGMTISEAKELKRDHNLWSVLARYMVMIQPRLARAIRFKECGIDTVDLMGEWRIMVDESTVFIAVSWREAKEFCAAKDACTL